jgi:hypothetical protein
MYLLVSTLGPLHSLNDTEWLNYSELWTAKNVRDSFSGARLAKLCGVEELLVWSLPSPGKEGEEQRAAVGELTTLKQKLQGNMSPKLQNEIFWTAVDSTLE